ncbi:hypothetical protein PYCH_17820 [Pyrococcus yayanosii CH1]|uniref:Uncharacterized protein n=1 Tax=Pyrococcus yayanosii (strain CH1 / JCM 16557) TaxID=529709 RepID=F8AHY4_PYRYC|nr:hypothetical protein PYCH_17820 [Pyrococcus yayanosii CH1]
MGTSVLEAKASSMPVVTVDSLTKGEGNKGMAIHIASRQD